MSMFRTQLAEKIFNLKYRHSNAETWEQLSETLMKDVVKNYVSKDTYQRLIALHSEMKIIAGGRYLYYAGRGVKYFNNCYVFLSREDTRESWSDLMYKAGSATMTGGGIGNDYTVYRPHGLLLSRTGGLASGPIPLMQIINDMGRGIKQGSSRRSANYASLGWKHGDISDFLHAKDWYNMRVKGTRFSIGELKEMDFNYPAPLDFTNISVNYDNSFLNAAFESWEPVVDEYGIDRVKVGPTKVIPDTFLHNVTQAMRTGEPGFSFNFGKKEVETGRNACSEVTSADDSDVCNLGSLNLANFDNINDFVEAVELMTIFLLCGTLVADLPFDKVALVREKNRRLGLGLMGIHEWLMKRGYKYEVVPELKQWLHAYRVVARKTATYFADRMNISRPVAVQAIAPTGTIGMLAGTTPGIEPLYAVAYKRRYLDGNTWKYTFEIDSGARRMIELGINPDSIETSLDLAEDYERRIKFQAAVQGYVDMGISSTINLPAWGSPLNDPCTAIDFAETLLKYSPYLRGFTCYPTGARGGQPITQVDYKEASKKLGHEFEEGGLDVCEITGRGGTCGS
jgi:ribonucleoside-diphosphate reductase alpha chain